MIVLTQSVFALEITSSVDASAVYTDNLSLAPDGLEQSDVVFRIDPSLGIEHQSQRTNLQLRYVFSQLLYKDSAENSASFHDGLANFSADIIEDILLVDSFALIEQQITSPEAAFWFTNVPIVDNRTDVTQFEIAPNLTPEILRHLINSRITVGTINYDDPDSLDVDYQTIRTTVNSPERDRGLRWGMTHDYSHYEYELPPESKWQLAYLTLAYDFLLSELFELVIDFGLESDYLDTSSAKLEEEYWLIGLRKESDDVLIELALGDRSFGSTYKALMRRQFSRSTLELSYIEEPFVQEDLFAQRSQESAAGLQDIPPGLDRPGTIQRFIWKRLSASFVREGIRNTIAVRGFSERREDIIDPRSEDGTDPGLITQSTSEEQYGAVVSWSHSLGSKTHATLEGFWSDREFASGNSDKIYRIKLEAQHQLGRRTSVTVWVARQDQSGSDNILDNHTENQAGLTLNRTFW
jgi:hypothetical protein